MYEWLIPDGFVAPSTLAERESGCFSHEAICALNVSDEDAEFFVDVFFIDREPQINRRFTVGASRTSRIIVGQGYSIEGSQALDVPLGVAFSIRVRSTTELAIQSTRVDTRAANNALMSAIIKVQLK
jgi:hypothetical protein